MPVNASLQDTVVADRGSTNSDPNTGHRDESGGGTNEADVDYRTSGDASTNAPTLVAGSRSGSAAFDLRSEDSRRESTYHTDSVAKNARQNSQDVHLQIPQEGSAARRPIETSIWDWDTPLESVGESSSYYYEPQGELLQERYQHPSKSEFSIPQALSSSGAHWPFPTSAVSASTSQGFAVPKRPPGAPGSVAGSKRKSADRESSSSGKQPDPKRSSRMMSESGEELTSPVDKPPAHSTRSHAGPGPGPGPRLRSATDTTDSRSRPSAADTEAAGPHAGTSNPRRTLTDPAIPMVLPARKVFPIQIGDKLFRLSGASISSDGKPILLYLLEVC